MSKIAVVQSPPVFLDRSGTIERATTLVSEAASEGTEVVIFAIVRREHGSSRRPVL